MTDFGANLKNIRLARKMTQDELAELLGTSKQVISRYENGQRSPKVSVVGEFARALGVSIGALTGDEAFSRHSIDGLIPREDLPLRRVPIIGDTAAGEPIIANRIYDEYVEIPDDGHRYDAALRVTGDSMEPRYTIGDLAFIRYQDDVEDGQIAAVCLDDTVTLKRVYHIPHGLQLVSDNPKYPPKLYTADDVYNAHLVGLAVGVLHWDE